MAPVDGLEARLALRLKMRHLVLLRLIQQHGSLTRVAEEMATSQPAVTHALAELEAMFGAPLFTRSARGMTPTAMGDVALGRAQAMLQDLGHWVRDMEAASLGRAAHLQVGVIPFIPGRLLAAAIGRARPQDRHLTVTLHESTSDHLLQWLRGHELDCVIGRTSAVLSMQGLVHEVLYEQQPRLIAHKSLATRLGCKPLSWPDLAQLDWVLGQRGTPMREQISDFFLRAGVAPPAPIVESLSAKVLGELISTNERAVSIVPSDIAEELAHLAGVGVVAHRFGWTLPPVSLFRRAEGSLREADALFAQALREVCRPLAAH